MAHNGRSANNWFGQVGSGQSMQPRPQVQAPTLSQIPGLSKATAALSLDDNSAPKSLFRDTDSAYVRLAKQGGRSDLLRMDQDSISTNHAPEPRALPEWLQKDMMNEDGNGDLAYDGDDMLNGYNHNQWDARRDNFTSDGQYSESDWPYKMNAESDGGRRYNQSESPTNYAGKYSENANWQSDSIPSSQQRPPSSLAAGVASGLRSRDSRPQWFQSPPHNDQRESNYAKASPGVQHNEVISDERYSPTRRRYSGQSSSQKPFADHNYQMPMTTETGSAFSDKKLPGDRSGFETSPQQQFSPADQQLSNANRMRRSDSMSKLLSFGYLRDAKNDSLKSRAPSHPRIDSSYKVDSYSTEYKEKMPNRNSSNIGTPQMEITQQGYVPTLISDPGYKRRKQSFEERPDFFRIGSSDSQSLLAHNGQKLLADGRPDVLAANDNMASTRAVSYSKTKPDVESKPDFFTLGSLNSYMDKQTHPSSSEAGILDKLNGYGIAQKSDFRRRKTDFNAPTVIKPVKAVSRF